MRIEPPPSDAVAPAQSPAAVAAAEPPLDPPGVRDVSHGFRVIPHASVSVKPQMASSGRFVLPRTIAPAARRRRTISPSASAGCVEAVRAPGGDLALEVLDVLDRDRHAGERHLRRPRPAASRASTRFASSRARSARTTR